MLLLSSVWRSAGVHVLEPALRIQSPASNSRRRQYTEVLDSVWRDVFVHVLVCSVCVSSGAVGNSIC